MGAVLVDIQGSFSVYKFVQKIRDFYEKNNLIDGSAPEGGWESPDIKQKAINDDKHSFIRTVLSNFYIFNCMDAAEFNLTIRSLANFFKSHKSIGMVILDGLHFIENLEFLNHQEKLQFSNNLKEASGKHNIQAMAEEVGDNVPNMDDFLCGKEKEQTKQEPVSTNN